MSLLRKVTALEKGYARLATIARARQANRTAEQFHAFWEQLEKRLQAEGHWCSPGEDFGTYLLKSLGFADGRFKQALAARDQSFEEELLLVIFRQFPDLEAVWRACTTVSKTRHILASREARSA